MQRRSEGRGPRDVEGGPYPGVGAQPVVVRGFNPVNRSLAVREIPHGLLELILAVHVLDAVIIGESPSEALRQGFARPVTDPQHCHAGIIQVYGEKIAIRWEMRGQHDDLHVLHSLFRSTLPRPASKAADAFAAARRELFQPRRVNKLKYYINGTGLWQTRENPFDPVRKRAGDAFCFVGAIQKGGCAVVNDDYLMLQFAQGNEKAMEILYQRWAPRILAFARRSLGDFHEAQDVAQESFLLLSKSATCYEPRGRFGAYLFRIAGNLVRSRHRKKVPLAVEDLDEEDVSSVEEQVAWRVDLEMGLQMIPEEQREALLLVVCGGLSYAEAAIVQDVSEVALAKRVSRARKGLYTVLTQKGKGGGSV